LRIVDSSNPAERAFLSRRYRPPQGVAEAVAAIIADVCRRGDQAVIDLTAKFGGPRLKPSELLVTEAEVTGAMSRASRETAAALRAAHKNIASFARKSLRRPWHSRNAQGAQVGERFDPFRRVGIYVPGGSAPLVSTGLMTVTFAATAGVPEIVVSTPPGPDGKVNDALLVALRIAGATQILRAGGAQAVAAMAHGTKTLAPVDKIFGPGNAYVVEAKRQLFGFVAVDLLPGPSEILVICDSSANPAWVAADLLAQCEHGVDSIAVAISPSRSMLARIEREVSRQMRSLTRQAQLQPAVTKNLRLVHCTSMDDAIALANDFAPEHLSVVTRNEDDVASKVFSAGAIFLGPYSPVAAGDFLAGPSHELPTGGAGKGFAGLTADQFQRRTSVVRYDHESLQNSEPLIRQFSAVEGLDAHGRSASIRLGTPPRRARKLSG
jgi:histidinol dehydrogenase